MKSESENNKGLMKKLRLRISLLLVLKYGLFSLALSGSALGMAVLLCRVLFAVPRQTLLPGLAVMVPVILWAFIRATKETPSQRAIYALLDDRNHCGGLLMSSNEVELGGWREQLPRLGAPGLKWRGGRDCSFFAAAAVFVALSFMIPQKYVDMTVTRPLNLDQDVEQLQQQVDLLEEENILDEDKAEELRQRLEEIKENASAYDPLESWEALDHLQENINQEAERFAASSLSEMENLAKMETLAQGLLEDGKQLDSSLLSEANSELARLAQSNALQNETFKKNVSADLLSSMKQGNLSAEQLKELLKAIKLCKAGKSGCMSKLCQAQLADPKKLALCEKSGNCNSSGLVAFLNENAGKMGTCEALSLYFGNPGRGGVNRGRGDAPMTWTEGTKEDNVTFKEQALPPASLAAFKDSLVVGMSASAPRVEENAEPRGRGVLDSAAAGSGGSFNQQILPRHKGVVRRYFENE